MTIGLLFKEKRPDLKSSLWGLILSVLALALEIALYYRLGYLTTLSSMYLALWPLSFFFFALELNISDQKEFKDHKNLRLASSFIYTSHLLFAIVIGPFVNNQLLFYILVALISTISAFILIYLKKYIKMPKIGKLFVRPFIACIGMGAAAAIVYRLLGDKLSNVAVLPAICVAAATYAVLLVALNALEKDDILMLPDGKRIVKLLRL